MIAFNINFISKIVVENKNEKRPMTNNINYNYKSSRYKCVRVYNCSFPNEPNCIFIYVYIKLF